MKCGGSSASERRAKGLSKVRAVRGHASGLRSSTGRGFMGSSRNGALAAIATPAKQGG